MTAICVVLNGSSCSGKSSIAAALQKRWPRPLQVTGIDTFLAAQSARFFIGEGEGFTWVPTTVDGEPAFDIALGPLGLGMIRASHAYWAACAAAGLDQVIDDVWLVPEQPAGIERALAGTKTIWVGVHCPLPIVEQRERERGDRTIGTARGQHGRAHGFRSYDLEVDTSIATPDGCARVIIDAVRAHA